MSDASPSNQKIIEPPTSVAGASSERKTRSIASRLSILIRRVHLYSGLFLLPWVIMYGVTGAMFNHLGLFPRVAIQPVDPSVVASSAMAAFPGPNELAKQVVESLRTASGNTTIELASKHGAEFTNELMFEMKDADGQHVVYMDTVSKSSWIVTQPKLNLEPPRLLGDIKTIRLTPDPRNTAQEAAEQILKDAGKKPSGHPQQFGWTKLNFLANVDGKPARVTYVLNDGHVDVNQFTGNHDMPLRQFLLRMHTSHGQPPHWNARMVWSIAVDTMAIAMVGWGLSGLFMWWQLKRTRMIGSVVIAFSLLTATAMWFGLHSFYATTRL